MGKLEVYLIKFNEVTVEGDIFLPGCFSTDSLDNQVRLGKIESYAIDEEGVKVVKEFYCENQKNEV